jgi:hypothetical protein
MTQKKIKRNLSLVTSLALSSCSSYQNNFYILTLRIDFSCGAGAVAVVDCFSALAIVDFVNKLNP